MGEVDVGSLVAPMPVGALVAIGAKIEHTEKFDCV